MRIGMVHRAEGELMARAYRPELCVFEYLAHRIDGEDTAGVGNQCGDLARLVRVFLVFLGIQETFLFQDRVKFSECFKDRCLAVKLHIR